MDVWGLVCSARGLSNDKTQRLVMLGLREYRRYGLIRATIHIPASAMLADGITKVGKFLQLLRYSTTGLILLEIYRAIILELVACDNALTRLKKT